MLAWPARVDTCGVARGGGNGAFRWFLVLDVRMSPLLIPGSPLIDCIAPVIYRWPHPTYIQICVSKGASMSKRKLDAL